MSDAIGLEIERLEKTVATLQARIKTLESGVQSVVREKKTYKRFNSQSSYDSAFAAYDRMHDALAALLQEPTNEP